MKNLIIIISLFLFSLNSDSQVDIKLKNDYLLKGKLITKIDKLIPQCGILAWATIVEFEVIYFSDSSYSEKIIPVVIACPNPYKTGLYEIGNTYELVLSSNKWDISEWVFFESSKELLTKYDMKKHYWFSKLIK
ncbi:hypothetical protein ACFSSB_01930 [Lacinutrix gracilariae]|uniref:Uncharacterized protein n=1 Tax=Lacinutrix gracilariae TaxID=1747198 RepID=A0ABW5JYM4_9FLAO